jgi:uncharacterized membrane protein
MPSWARRAVLQLEDASLLDRAAAGLSSAVDACVPAGPRRDALRGVWLGHALHPLLTDFPLGTWMSASLLDLFGGRRSRPAATGLVGFGVLAALPTALTGLAEWRATERGARRLGVVHAAVNTTALALYTSSLVARLRHRHARAVAYGVAGGLTATVGGWFGGHLSLAHKVGTHDPSSVR